MPLMAADETENYKVQGYATTFGEAYQIYSDFDGEPVYEVIEAGALDGADLSDVIMQYDHAGRVFARTSNETLELNIDEHGLKVSADLGKTENARNLHEDIASGMVTKMSWCFIIEDEEYNQAKRTWYVKKVGKVFDVSAVSIPANPGTDISARRRALMDGAIQKEQAERLEKAKLAERKRKLRLRLKIDKIREELE